MGKIPYSRAYYWGKDCHHGWFPTDEEFGLLRKQTPAVQQVTAMAGTLSAFESGAERVLRTMSGVRLSESTVQRTTEDVGEILVARARTSVWTRQAFANRGRMVRRWTVGWRGCWKSSTRFRSLWTLKNPNLKNPDLNLRHAMGRA
jgi:hypothetical protein